MAGTSLTDRDWDSFVTEGGELTRDGFEIRFPVTPPEEVISETYGVATGFVVAFADDNVLPIGPRPDEDASLQSAIGVSSRHAVIYRRPDFELPSWLQGFEWWADRFPTGFSCGAAFETADFDVFEPVDCSMVELTIGPLDEINVIGGDWF